MNLLWRTLLHSVLSRFRSRLDPLDVVRTPFRVLPTDLDVYRHMNNGRYLSIADIGRYDLLARAGLLGELKKRGWYPVVVASSITYRKSLMPWQRFVIESRFLGFDERCVYVEQRFVVDGEIHARMHLRGRFLKRRGGLVPMAELQEVLGVGADELTVPAELLRWGDETALPSTRQPAPSNWE